jgi:serine/threonine-protein kinase RsbW
MAEPLAMRMARKQAAAAAVAVGASDYDARRIELAVGEALSNVRRHAYDSTPGPIEMEITHDGGRLAVAVHDEGKGLPFEPRFPGLPQAHTGGGGYGLYVIKEVVDDARIEHPGGKGRGTSVHMAILLR